MSSSILCPVKLNPIIVKSTRCNELCQMFQQGIYKLNPVCVLSGALVPVSSSQTNLSANSFVSQTDKFISGHTQCLSLKRYINKTEDIFGLMVQYRQTASRKRKLNQQSLIPIIINIKCRSHISSVLQLEEPKLPLAELFEERVYISNTVPVKHQLVLPMLET